MSIVKIKTKGQMTLPSAIRARVGLHIGDLLKATVERGKITLTPQSLVDRELALSLEDVQKGRMHGPFGTADEAISFLHKSTRQRSKTARL